MTDSWNESAKKIEIFSIHYEKSNFSKGQQITWGGPLRHWEYPQPTPDASEAQQIIKN